MGACCQSRHTERRSKPAAMASAADPVPPGEAARPCWSGGSPVPEMEMAQELRRRRRSSSRRRRQEEDGAKPSKRVADSGTDKTVSNGTRQIGNGGDAVTKLTKSDMSPMDTKVSPESPDESYDSLDSGIQVDTGGADSGVEVVPVEGGWSVKDRAGREHPVTPMDPRELKGHCRALELGAVRVGTGRYALPRHGLLSLPSYSAPRTVRPGEVVVCSVPKSGTTWTLEMTWLVNNDCDFAGARATLDQNRYTEVGNLFYLGLTPSFLREYIPVLLTQFSKLIGLLQLFYLMLRSLWRSSGLVKTHVPLSMLPPDLLETNKVIYVTRNPKDALVSYYHHFTRCRVIKYSGSMDDLAEDYIEGRLPGLPFFSHVLEAWRQRHHPNMLFLFYEDMKRDMPGTLRRVAKFLGKSLTDEQVQQLCRHLDFEHMKHNDYANHLMYQTCGIMDMPSFIRQGQVGKWRQHFSPETDRKLNEWIRRSTAGTGLSYEGVQ